MWNWCGNRVVIQERLCHGLIPAFWGSNKTGNWLEEAIRSGRENLILPDEVCNAVALNLLPEQRLIAVLRQTDRCRKAGNIEAQGLISRPADLMEPAMSYMLEIVPTAI